MPLTPLTVDEIVSVLKRSCLPTILVEGRDDMITYRWIEEKIGIYNANILPCCGRDALIAVYRKRDLFNNINVVFLADQDTWIFTSIDDEYSDIIFTNGFSIENDILDSSCVKELMSEVERQEFDKLVNILSKWFAFEINEFLLGKDSNISLHPNKVVLPGTYDINFNAIFPREYNECDKELIQRISENFTIEFRGKSLLDLFVRILSDKNRRPKYSKKSLLEIGTKIKTSCHLDRIINKVALKLEQKNIEQINCS